MYSKLFLPEMLLAVLFFVGLFFSRPFLLGYVEAKVGVVLVILFIVVWVIFKESFRKKFISLFVVSWLFVTAYSFYVYSQTSQDVFFNYLIISFVYLLGIVLIMESDVLRVNFSFCFVIIYFFIILSSFITFLYVVFDGNVVDNIHAVNYYLIEVKDRGGWEYWVSWPFSSIVTTFYTEKIDLPRFGYFLIEPGAALAVLVLWFALVSKKSLLVRLFSYFSFILTFSTAAIPSLLLYELSLIAEGKKINIKMLFTSIGFVGLFLLALFYIPNIGIFDKLLTHGTAITDRSDYFLSGGYFSLVMVVLYVIFLFYFFSVPVNLYTLILIVFMSFVNVFAFTPLFFIVCFFLIGNQRRFSSSRVIGGLHAK